MNKKIAAVLALLFALSIVFCACAKPAPGKNAVIEIHSDTPAPTGGDMPTGVPATDAPATDAPASLTPATAVPETELPETDLPVDTGEPAVTSYPTGSLDPMDQSVFDSCAFVGNSTFEGLYKFGVITHGKFFTRVGLNINSVYTDTTTDGSVPVIDELNSGSYSGVIMCFGENELGWPNLNVFVQKYEQFCRDVWTRQPNAKLFITGLPPISAKKSAAGGSTGVTNENINTMNALLEELCSRTDNLYFITVPDALYNEDHVLPDDASGDGLHLNLAYSRIWADQIMNIVGRVLGGARP